MTVSPALVCTIEISKLTADTVIGIVLISAGFALLLLPLSLATYQASQWRSGSIIAMFVVGFCCLVAFAVHERFTARKPFLPFHFLTDRTVFGACALSGTLWTSFYCWDAYFSSYLQVVYNLSISDAGYVANIYNIGSCFFAIIVGGLVRWSGRIKWIALAAVPLQILGTGLMIYFRQPGKGLGYVIMCQIFISFSGGALVITEQMAVMAAVGPENVATVLALEALFTAVGGAVGPSISGAIWTNTLPGALEQYLPASAKGQASEIYASLVTQLSYEWGSPEREGIIEAYAYTQRYMCIAATAVLVLAFFWVLMWRDIRVKDFKQPAGSTVV